MKILILLFGTFLALGMFFLVSRILNIPSIATCKAMISLTKKNEENVKSLDAFIHSLVVKSAKYLPMNEHKKILLKHTLNAVGITDTPEEYTVNAILKATLISLMSIPCFYIFPLLAPVLILLSVLYYFKEIRKADDRLKAKQESIERELPRFVSTIAQEIQSNRDVLSMLEKYKKNTTKVFAKELDIVTADMRSGNYEIALNRFQTKFNSPNLSSIVNELIRVINGDDGTIYFQMLAREIKEQEIQRLKGEALKIPSRIKVFSFLMLMCILFMYLVVIIFEIIRSLGMML